MCLLADLVDILIHQDPWQGIIHKVNRMTQKFTHWKEGEEQFCINLCFRFRYQCNDTERNLPSYT